MYALPHIFIFILLHWTHPGIQVNGDNAAPVFAYLRNTLNVSKIKWNFEKVLISIGGLSC